MSRSPNEDRIWRALAHYDRRRILDVLRAKPETTGAITAAIGLSRHNTVQHLQVLRQVDLVLTEAKGRQRINYLNPVPIRLIYERWVSRYEDVWSAALIGFKRTVEEVDQRKGERDG